MPFLIILTLLVSLGAPVVAAAESLNVPSAPISRAEFHEIAKDLGFAMSFPASDRPSPYEWAGFDVGVGYLFGYLENDEWAEPVNPPGHIHEGYLRAVKGLPGEVDVGLMVGQRLGQAELFAGTEVKWAAFSGEALPTIGFRAAYTRLITSNFLALQTGSLQAQVDYALPVITPYGGLGMTSILSTPSAGVTAEGLDETAHVPHAWVGAKIEPFPLLSITLQAQYGLNGAPPLGMLQVSAGL